MRAFIRDRRRSETIVISSHNLDDIEKLCTHVAFIADGRLERMATLSELTSGAGRIVVTLRRRPGDVAALEAVMPGLRVSWQEDVHGLSAEFDPATPPEAVNALLLPALVPFGVVSVSSGQTLEQAYLGRRPPHSP